MTYLGWLECIRKSRNDPDIEIMLAEYLSAVDNARGMLYRKGYGVIGTPVERQVDEVPSRESLG